MIHFWYDDFILFYFFNFIVEQLCSAGTGTLLSLLLSILKRSFQQSEFSTE